MSTDGDPLTDEQFWRSAVAGDGHAFAVVFERHGDAVYTHCRRRVQVPDDAEDLTSVTFLEAWRLRDRVRFVDGSARPWLLLVATNVTRNHERARRRYRSQLSRLPHETPVVDAPAESAERAEIVRAVTRAVASMNAADSAVISLCDLAGLSYADAAAVLGVPVGTVRSRLSRARARLRRDLAPLNPYLAASADATAAYGEHR